MSEVFSMIEGCFGRVAVIEICHDLVLHAHLEHEFGYWLCGGECRGLVGGQALVYSESFSVVVNKYEAHDLFLGNVNEPALILKMYINEVWFDEHFSRFGCGIHFGKSQLINSHRMKAQCWILAQKILFKKSFPSIENDVFMLLQSTMYSNFSHISSYSNSFFKKELNYHLDLALKCIHDNTTMPNLIQNISKLVGVSRSRLYELFKNELQSTPNLIFNCVLLDEATKRMIEDQKDVELVSRKLGFSTAANFSRFFRKNKGVTPTKYKKGYYVL